jgi:hypothetical protein
MTLEHFRDYRYDRQRRLPSRHRKGAVYLDVKMLWSATESLRDLRSQGNEQERFTAPLFHHQSVDLLRELLVLKRQAAPGLDGVTWEEYETGLDDQLLVGTGPGAS